MARRAGYGFVIAHQCTGEPVMLDPAVAYGDGHAWCRVCGKRTEVRDRDSRPVCCSKPMEIVDVLSRSLSQTMFGSQTAGLGLESD